ncbi:MAG: DapH/DapD/GlmU-related protein [Crocinitomicaceae bacterium]|nr:DapH/DapD/GlmU-related protein [Crocinitomicaceae bacterium]
MASIKQILQWFNEQGVQHIDNGVDLSQIIEQPRSIQEAEINQITFIGAKFASTAADLILSSNAVIIIVQSNMLTDEEIAKIESKVLVFVENPKSSIIEFCKRFLNFEAQSEQENIDETAVISTSAKIGANAQIAAFVVIGDHVVIGDNCRIGSGTILHENTVLGNEVIVGACNVIGGTGFGYSQVISDVYEQFPHYGKVILEDGVHIGNNTCIDRGSLSDTILHEGVKVDNLVHIAHNVKIGENSLIIAKSMIAGSVTIGKNCWIAPSSCIRNGISIGDNVTVGLGSTVTKSVTKDQTVMGSPAMPIEDFNALRQIQKDQLKKS